MALYTDARVREINIKLILNSRSAGSIITKQLINQLGCQVDCAATAWIITADGNTKTPIGEIDNFPFKINRIQIPTKHSQVSTTCRHFKTQCTEEPLIEFEDTSMLPTIETYQVSWVDDYQTELPPPPTWKEKKKAELKKNPNYLDDQNDKASGTPCLTCGKILPDKELWNNMSGRRETCNKICQYTILINDWVQKGTLIKDTWKQALNRLDSYLHDNHKIWRMASTKAKGAMSEEIREIKNNSWTPKYNGPDYPEDDFFTDDPDTFQN
ncbi:hypothetical protein G9A89_015197 [Geosiphon pyriformis]|nr:hypothetical protein G9A89_015197 [Geosiphon pyriformis]